MVAWHCSCILNKDGAIVRLCCGLGVGNYAFSLCGVLGKEGPHVHLLHSCFYCLASANVPELFKRIWLHLVAQQALSSMPDPTNSSWSIVFVQFHLLLQQIYMFTHVHLYLDIFPKMLLFSLLSSTLVVPLWQRPGAIKRILLQPTLDA